ncbi:Oidioi.mRNA.OKI2018_I69.XSR.g15878.t1.cds [Oikopleura dioica]|uniref:Oidioi.mRNA.OKI2018_I69.XSR.g15878.t1.cds n=1 Tax=Oikopleura dioica TaxID=34765 RepID=A0ABN7SJC0_OIKDI|nr:Oidioi.mRNA.OKI2018_I69.XSR.g15878.t1.cds [Oikopleura dioica]
MKSDNVRVHIRIRPISKKEIDEGAQECLIAAGPQIDCRGSQFIYDKVFGYSVEQTEIYNQTVEPMLASLLDGFNQTVFAYGQTGSGKTYTMGGEFGKRDREHDGILPRVAEDLFERYAGSPDEPSLFFVTEGVHKTSLNFHLQYGRHDKRWHMHIRECSSQAAILECSSAHSKGKRCKGTAKMLILDPKLINSEKKEQAKRQRTVFKFNYEHPDRLETSKYGQVTTIKPHAEHCKASLRYHVIQRQFRSTVGKVSENPTETKVHRFDTTLHGLGENRLEAIGPVVEEEKIVEKPVDEACEECSEDSETSASSRAVPLELPARRRRKGRNFTQEEDKKIIDGLEEFKTFKNEMYAKISCTPFSKKRIGATAISDINSRYLTITPHPPNFTFTFLLFHSSIFTYCLGLK